MKILLIAPPLKVVGGQSIQANRLVSRLANDDGLEVTFQPAIQFLRYRYIRTITNAVVYLRMLLQKVPKHDVIHIFTAGNFAFLLIAAPALIIGKLFGKRAILHYHDGRAFDHLRHWKGAVSLCKLASGIVVPTGFLVNVFARFGLPAIPIANTLEPMDYPFRLRLSPAPTFLHNRGLEEEYNVPCTLRAFAIIQQSYPEAQLVIAHSGSLRSKLEALAGSLNLHHVIFTGAVSENHMLRLYNSADIYLSSADADNMPGSVLEAFAAGLPVVATRAGGTEWIIRDEENGLLADCGDHAGMAAQALRLLQERGLAARLATNARSDSGLYSWAQIGWRWVELYTQCPNAAHSHAAVPAEVECSSR